MWRTVGSWEMEYDSSQYISLADDLADGMQDSASARLPAYPLLTGLLRSPEAPHMRVLVANHFMEILAALLFYLALHPLSRFAATGTALLVLFFLPYVHYANKVLPESLTVLLVALSVAIFSRLPACRSAASCILASSALGLVISLGIMAKPVVQFAVLPVLAVPLLHRDGLGLPARMAMCSAIVLTAAILPGLWRMHNRAAFGLDALSTQDAFEPMARFALLAGETTQEEVWSGAYTRRISAPADGPGGIDFGIRDSIYRAETARLIKEHFLRILLPHLTTFYAFASPYEGAKLAADTYATEWRPLLISHSAIMVAFGVFCAAGWVLLASVPPGMIRIGRMGHFLVLWTVVFILVTGPLRFLRYGLVFYWSMFAAALLGVERLASFVRRRSGKSC